MAVKEMGRVAALGARTAFVAAMPIKGKSFGHPDFDPVWQAAQELAFLLAVDFLSSMVVRH